MDPDDFEGWAELALDCATPEQVARAEAGDVVIYCAACGDVISGAFTRGPHGPLHFFVTCMLAGDA